jgi:hypothetical protein
MIRALVVVLGALALAACHDPGAPCGDGYCPAGTVCAPAAELCLHPEQLELCRGVADGTTCAIRDGRAGACHADLCLPVVCGDGRVDRDEECDGAALGAHDDCLDLGEGYHQGGPLRCTSTCRYDRSTCGGRCGDGEVSGSEACDSGPGTRTCEDEGFYGGDLGCTAGCQLDVSACLGECGDGRRTSEEECDGTDFGASTCNTYGFYGGTLRCTADCTIEQDHCEGRCGDGEKNGPEVCDGADLGGLSCQTFGWYAGAVTCGANCLSLDRSACEGFCGDGVKNGNELCDGLDQDGQFCTSYGAMAGALSCNAFCQPTTERCYWGKPRSLQTPLSSVMATVWGTGEDDLWIMDYSMRIAHYDGHAWTESPIELTTFPASLWSPAPGKSILMTQDGDIYDLDATSAKLVHRTGRMYARAWGPSVDELWVADYTAVSHYRDGTWQPVEGIAGAHGIWGTASDNVWIASGATLFHFTGTAWETHTLPGQLTMHMWGTSADDMIATRAAASSGVYHYDGRTWTPVNVAPLQGVRTGWDAGAGERVFVGFIGSNACMLRRRDGVTDTTYCHDFVESGFGTADGRLWLASSVEGLLLVDGPGFVGAGALRAGSVNEIRSPQRQEAWALAGFTLARRTTAGVALVIDRVRDFWLHGPEIWAGGHDALHHFDGESWRQHPIPAVEAVCGTSPTSVWMGSHSGLWHFDGDAIEQVSSEFMLSLACAPDGTVWSTTGSNVVAQYRDGTWTEMIAASGQVRSLAVRSRDDVWIFGDEVLHYDGDTLAPHAQPLPWMWSGAVASPRDIWAASSLSLYHFDGTQWSPVTTAPTRYTAVALNAHGEVWAGRDGQLDVFDGRLPVAYGGSCTDTLRTYCNVTLRGHTAQTEDGPTGCHEGVAHPGGELHYKIEVPVTGRLTATVASRHDVDLSAVTADERGGCDAASCIEGQPSDTEVALDVQQGQTYYLVVGARDGAAPFTLDVRCEKQ